jgi:hypothetical protein
MRTLSKIFAKQFCWQVLRAMLGGKVIVADL